MMKKLADVQSNIDFSINLHVNNMDSKLKKQQGDEVTNIYLSFTCAGRPHDYLFKILSHVSHL